MTIDDLNVVLFALFIAAMAAIPIYAYRQSVRQMRGTFGRPYAAIVAAMFQESARRSGLLVRLVEARDARIARLERRAEGGR